MKVAICGFTASGKSYQAKKIAEQYELRYVSGGELLLQTAGMSAEGVFFWIDDPGIQFSKQRTINPNLDRRTDELILQMAQREDEIIFDSWTLPWLYQKSDLFKIYLAASLNARAKMAYGSREQKPYSLQEIMGRIEQKDDDTRRLFRELYGFDISDYSLFDLVLDNSALRPEETSLFLISAVTKRFETSPASSR